MSDFIFSICNRVKVEVMYEENSYAIEIQMVSTISISVYVDLKEHHSSQTGDKAEQDVVEDQSGPLHHDEGLMSQEVGQQEDWEKECQVGISPDGEQVVCHLWGRGAQTRQNEILALTICVCPLLQHAYLIVNHI